MSPSVFATLTPENAVAQKCLASLVEKRGLASLPSVRLNPEISTVDDRSAQSKYQLILSFDIGGSGRDGSWVVGKLGAGSPSIDLPICSSRSRQLHEPRICVIFIHPQSGVLMLRNANESHRITYLLGDGYADVKLSYRDKHVLHLKTNHLRIGPLDFVLEFSVKDLEAYAAGRRNYMRQWHQGWDVQLGWETQQLQKQSNKKEKDKEDGDDSQHDKEEEKQHQNQEQGHSHLDTLPTREQLRIRDIILHHTVSRGAFGIVMAGVDRWSGEMRACKTIHCRNRDEDKIRNEVRIAGSIPIQTVGLVPLLTSWCEHGQSPPCFESALETVYMIMPYALHSFATMEWHIVTLEIRLALFRQVFEGLRNLHAGGIMHRDISPRNLLVFSLTPPRAAICDYGKSKIGVQGYYTALGPKGFTAPEVSRPDGYTNAIDIFSLGLSLLATFGNPVAGGWIDAISSHDGQYQRILELLATLEAEDSIPKRLGSLLRSMLAWDPTDRPTADEAVAHPVWGQTVKEGSSQALDSVATSTIVSGSGGSSHDNQTSANAARLRRSGGMPPSGSCGTSKKRTAETNVPGSGMNKRKQETCLGSKHRLSPTSE